MIYYGFCLLGVVIVLIVLYIICKEIGIVIKLIIVSFGISGIVIGIGVKLCIENVVGGLILLLICLIKIGDFCELGGVIGIVENINLYLILICMLECYFIFVFNILVFIVKIVNYSKCDNFYFDKIFLLSYDSVYEDLEEIMEKLWNVFV